MDIEKIITGIPTAVSILTNVVLGYLLLRRSIATTEFSIMEKTCKRQEAEIRDLHQQVGQLKERTDLMPILTAITEWRDEGRIRFTAATAQLEENTKALTTLIRSHQDLLREMFPARSNLS